MTDRFSEFLGRPQGGKTWAETAAPTSPPVAVLEAESGEYRPWGREVPETSDVLEIRRKDGSWKQINRAYLVGVDGVGDRMVSLVCTAFAVTLEGRNLGELRTRLKAHAVDYLQEFDPARWPAPSPGTPVIDRIEILELRSPRIGQGAAR